MPVMADRQPKTIIGHLRVPTRQYWTVTAINADIISTIKGIISCLCLSILIKKKISEIIKIPLPTIGKTIPSQPGDKNMPINAIRIKIEEPNLNICPNDRNSITSGAKKFCQIIKIDHRTTMLQAFPSVK